MGLGGTFTERLGSYIIVSCWQSVDGYAVSEADCGARSTGNTEPGVMVPGDCFTIEPILVQGSKSRGRLWDDGWTVATEVRDNRIRIWNPINGRVRSN